MKLISWNVNGLRAVMGKGFSDIFSMLDADIFCLQETKLQEGQIALDLPGCSQYWNYADKKGYSGTAVFSKRPALSVRYGMGIDEFDHEGRLITLEFDDFFLVCCYTPNSQDGLKRLPWRMAWEDAFRGYLKQLEQSKPVILCGDLNVAHNEIDIKNPRANRMNAGFTDEEREKMTALLSAGFTDTYRFLHPEEVKYSWWSYRFNARANNAGWRIDYFIVSDCLKERVTGADILNDIFGSDHCPVMLDLRDAGERAE
ncbi:MAG: exodeoxyribonuclease III [Clostridiales bacterium]|nr:exodeoxyribonuclease III [Clostridiales bacterium]